MLAGENNGVWRLCGRRGRRTRLCEAAWENTKEKREGPYAHLGQDSSVGGAGNLILYFIGVRFGGAEESVCFWGCKDAVKKRDRVTLHFYHGQTWE